MLYFVRTIIDNQSDFSSSMAYTLVNIPFHSPTLRSSHLAHSIRGPFTANISLRGSQETAQCDLIIDDIKINPTSENHNTRFWNKIAIIVPSAALTTLTLVGLPAASNAMTMSMTGTYSAWLASLTDSGFYQAFSLVFLSEIGDKTFFVAALLAAKLSRVISFIGSIGALAVMTVISVIIGQVFHAVPTEIANGVPLDDVAAVIAFTYFGIKILSEAFDNDEEGKSAMDEEFEEAEETVKGSDTITKASAG